GPRRPRDRLAVSCRPTIGPGPAGDVDLAGASARDVVLDGRGDRGPEAHVVHRRPDLELAVQLGRNRDVDHPPLGPRFGLGLGSGRSLRHGGDATGALLGQQPGAKYWNEDLIDNYHPYHLLRK